MERWRTLEILRQLSEFRRELDASHGLTDLEMPLGVVVPNVTLLTAQAQTPIALHKALSEVATALIFLHPGCKACHTVARGIHRVARFAGAWHRRACCGRGQGRGEGETIH